MLIFSEFLVVPFFSLDKYVAKADTKEEPKLLEGAPKYSDEEKVTMMISQQP